MRNKTTDEIWGKLNDALHQRNVTEARSAADLLLTPTHRDHLVDTTWDSKQLKEQWGLSDAQANLVKPLADRLDLVNRQVDHNWELAGKRTGVVEGQRHSATSQPRAKTETRVVVDSRGKALLWHNRELAGGTKLLSVVYPPEEHQTAHSVLETLNGNIATKKGVLNSAAIKGALKRDVLVTVNRMPQDRSNERSPTNCVGKLDGEQVALTWSTTENNGPLAARAAAYTWNGIQQMPKGVRQALWTDESKRSELVRIHAKESWSRVAKEEGRALEPHAFSCRMENRQALAQAAQSQPHKQEEAQQIPQSRGRSR